jgi:hypothetical protein
MLNVPAFQDPAAPAQPPAAPAPLTFIAPGAMPGLAPPVEVVAPPHAAPEPVPGPPAPEPHGFGPPGAPPPELGDQQPADPLAAYRAVPVQTPPPPPSWRAIPGVGIEHPAIGRITGGSTQEIEAYIFQHAREWGPESATDALFALQQLGAQGGAAPAGGGQSGYDITIQRDMMSQVDPRAAANAFLAQQARHLGEEEVRRANAQRFMAAAAGQQATANEQERMAAQRLMEQQEASKEAHARLANVDRVLEGLQNASIDPERFLNTGGNRVGAVLATALGALGSLAGSPNNALGIIDGAIRRDIAAQQTALESGHRTAGAMQRGLEQFRSITNDDQAARDAYRAAYLTALGNRIGALSTQASGVYADRLSRLATLVEQERSLAAAAVPHRLGQISMRMRHASETTAQSLLNPPRPANSAFNRPEPQQGAQQAPGAAPTPDQAEGTPQQPQSLLEAPAQPGTIPQINTQATEQVVANLPGLGRVPVDRDVHDESLRNPTRAAAMHVRRQRQRPAAQTQSVRFEPLEGTELARGQQIIRREGEQQLGQFDFLTPVQGRETTARRALETAALHERLIDTDATLGSMQDLFDTVERFRSEYRAHPGSFGSLLLSPEGARVRGALNELRQIRQIATGRGVLNEGDREVLDEEIPTSRWGSQTVPGVDTDNTLNSITGLLQAWMRSISRRARSMGYDVNSIYGASNAREAQQNAASGQAPGDLAVRRAASNVEGTPPRRGE